ncbi:MAG TPA: hypothetical protein PLY32_04265 [Salinivirgaceae bacterium]|nr:hypothetical protein [Salinivirgaceae bacterium]HQA76317.1 hypothetical protein [Salinivirgaceae bacterium]
MKKIKFYPFLLSAFVAVVAVSCVDIEGEEFCQEFELVTNPTCEFPTVCCPDEGDCYYLAPSTGKKYPCNSSLATANDKDGCNLAQERYIEDNCDTKISAADRKAIKLELTAFTREMMLKARNYSLCY